MRDRTASGDKAGRRLSPEAIHEQAVETEIDGSFSLSTDRCLRGAGTYVADMDVPDAAHSTARASSGQPGTSSLRSTYLVPDGD